MCVTSQAPHPGDCIRLLRLWQGGDEIARTARVEILSRRHVPSDQVDKLVADGHAYVQMAFLLYGAAFSSRRRPVIDCMHGCVQRGAWVLAWVHLMSTYSTSLAHASAPDECDLLRCGTHDGPARRVLAVLCSVDCPRFRKCWILHHNVQEE